MPKYTKTLVSPAGWVPSHKSRIPPCTINTERVISEPITNHHVNERRAMTEPVRQAVSPVVTLAKGFQTVKNKGKPWSAQILPSPPALPVRI